MTAYAEPEIYTSWRECRVIAVPGALASAGIAYDFPGVDYFRILSVAAKLHTAAGGGARQVIAELRDSTAAVVYGVTAPATQAGGLTVVYSFAPNLTANGSSVLGFQQAPFLDGKLPENLTLVISVSATQAADALSDVRILVEKWPRVHPDYQR